jgi:catechol 2,3-dioxygenase-like lactoylglutathione lyase family enzyme
MTDHTADVAPFEAAWQGIHHVALVTRDLDSTISFYRDMLGMEVVFIAPAGELHGRHGAVRPGGDPDRPGLHFFEYPQAPLFGPHDRSLQAAVFDPGATFLSHISLALPDEDAGLALRERLTCHGVEATPIMDQGRFRNIGFLDNNGMSLEAAWPRGPVQQRNSAGGESLRDSRTVVHIRPRLLARQIEVHSLEGRPQQRGDRHRPGLRDSNLG